MSVSSTLQKVWDRYAWWLFILTPLAVGLLGYRGFTLYHACDEPPLTCLDILYRTLQLFALESGAVERTVEHTVPWELEVARLLAPVVALFLAVSAALVYISRGWQWWRLLWVRRHYVICGLGRKGLQLVRELIRDGEKVVVIESNDQNDGLKTCRELGAIVMVGDASAQVLLQKARVDRARTIVVLCADDAKNVQIAVRARELVAARRRNVDVHVRCYVQIVDLHLLRRFPMARHEGAFEVFIVNTFEITARLLLRQQPLDYLPISPDDPRHLQLLVVGFGRLGQCVALQAARIGHCANLLRPRITVIDTRAEERAREFYCRYPQFGNVCEVDLLQADSYDPQVLARIAAWAHDESSITTIVVCLDDDSRSLSCALTIDERLGPHEIPILVRLSEETGLASLLETPREDGNAPCLLRAFGMVSHVSSREILFREKLDTLARFIHANYLESIPAERASPETIPSHRPWDRLPHHFKESNRQQADHIAVKLRAIGCFSSAEPARDAEPVEFTTEEVERMSKMEHARWNAERWLDGWKLGPSDKANKISPYLVPWEELDEEIREYDRRAVRDIPRQLALIGERVYRLPAGD
jgi:hypothetical protein